MLPPPTDGIALGMIRVHSTRPNSLSTHIAQKHPRPPRTNLSPKLKKSSSSTKRTKYSRVTRAAPAQGSHLVSPEGLRRLNRRRSASRHPGCEEGSQGEQVRRRDWR